jgi:hypothetical protein
MECDSSGFKTYKTNIDCYSIGYAVLAGEK